MEQERPEFQRTMESILTLFRYLRRNKSADPVTGLTGKKCALLRYVSEHPEGVTVGDISRRFFINKSSASELVKKLTQEGYLTRSRDPEDNRRVSVTLTSEGLQIARRAEYKGMALLRQKLSLEDDESLEKLYTAFSHLLTVLEIDPDEYK